MSGDKNASQQTSPQLYDPHHQEVPPGEVPHSRAGARGVRAGGNAGAMGDPASDQSQHNYQVSRDTDMTQHADDAARRREEIDNARINKVHKV